MYSSGRSSELLLLSFFFFFSYFLLEISANKGATTQGTNHWVVKVGAVLDLGSPFGSMTDLCINMAIDDFYSDHAHYKTRLQLDIKDANTLVDVNFAVQELLQEGKVHGVLGSNGPMQDAFVAELGERVHVPVISFSSRTSILSHSESRYSVRTSPDDAVQARALAALCLELEWQKVVVLYEDTEYGSHFVSQLNKAFQEVEVRMECMVAFPLLADDSFLLNQLKKLVETQTRVFVVHMSPLLGYRLFALVKSAGMMSEGYAWIITDSLSSFMDSMDSTARDSMEGVLGIRPYVAKTKNVESFRERWRRNAVLKKSEAPIMELNIYGLWAYDTIHALAFAVEKIGSVNSSFSSHEATRNGSESAKLRISSIGPMLLNELSSTKFKGLRGDFELVEGRLKPSSYEIFNLIGSGEKSVGFWVPERGIIKEFILSGESRTSAKGLKQILWPGDSVTQPRGWGIPATLRVGVPWKQGFTEFVKVEYNSTTNTTNASGFAIDIFLASLELLPYQIKYEFHCFNSTEESNGSYDGMLRQIPERFDMVVGDTTNWASRAEYVQFSLPYSESGAVLVVRNKRPFDMWIFIKPLSWDLWLAVLLACILIGIVLRVLENRDGQTSESVIEPQKRLHRTSYFSPVTVLAFPERNMVSNNWSLFVLVFWIFMAFILMQSYTANLSAILTVDQLKFAFSDSYYIGYQDGSFMKSFLTENLHISESRLRSYASAEEYHLGMSLGSENEGIDAIFDEIPYMKVFLNKYDSRYKMFGPQYRTGGFGFAFPIGSPLAADFSKAILDVTQGPSMNGIEQKNFGPGYSSQDPLSSKISQQTSSLSFLDFAGLFIIVGSMTASALFFSATPLGRKLTKTMEYVICECRNWLRSSKVNSAEINMVDRVEVSPAEHVNDSDAQAIEQAPRDGAGTRQEMHEGE